MLITTFNFIQAFAESRGSGAEVLVLVATSGNNFDTSVLINSHYDKV